MAERDDIEAARRGDRTATERLLENRRRWVLARCLRATGDLHAAEDLCQEVLLRAYQRLGELRDPAAFAGWLGRLVGSACADWHRRSRPWHELADGAASGGPGDLLAGAPDEVAEPLRLFYLEGLTLAETAARLGWSPTTVKSRLQLGRRWLREVWHPMHDHEELARRRREWLAAALAAKDLSDAQRRTYQSALEAMDQPRAAEMDDRVPPATVLLVDRPGPIAWNGRDLGALRDELRYRGFPATVARSTTNLVERLRRDRIDILVLGAEATEDLWALLREIRTDRAARSVSLVLLVNAGGASQKVAYRAWQAGVDCFLTKPVDLFEAAHFVARLDAMLRLRDLEILATDHAWREEWDDALECLRQALHYADLDPARRDVAERAWGNPAFRPLHEEPAFLALVGSRPVPEDS